MCVNALFSVLGNVFVEFSYRVHFQATSVLDIIFFFSVLFFRLDTINVCLFFLMYRCYQYLHIIHHHQFWFEIVIFSFHLWSNWNGERKGAVFFAWKKKMKCSFAVKCRQMQNTKYLLIFFFSKSFGKYQSNCVFFRIDFHGMMYFFFWFTK